jgi:hypothetical protein
VLIRWTYSVTFISKKPVNLSIRVLWARDSSMFRRRSEAKCKDFEVFDKKACNAVDLIDPCRGFSSHVL